MGDFFLGYLVLDPSNSINQFRGGSRIFSRERILKKFSKILSTFF